MKSPEWGYLRGKTRAEDSPPRLERSEKTSWRKWPQSCGWKEEHTLARLSREESWRGGKGPSQ